MSDRPTGANGKRNQAWGTTRVCPACGECLCFGCHPHGPCIDDHHLEAEGNDRYQVLEWREPLRDGVSHHM